MLQVSPAVPPRYKRRKVSAIRQFPRGCGPNAVKLSPKPEIDTSSTVGFEDGNVVETGRLIGASDVGEEPVVQGLLSASHPERMEHPNSLISDVLVNNTAETNPNSLISDVLVNNTAETNPEEVKLEVDGLVKEISELAKLQNGNCYSKLYRLPKRRKVSAIRQFPPGCGLNAGCGSKDGHQLVGAAPTLLKAESLSRKEIDEANKNSMDDGSLRVTSAETVEVQTRWNAGNEAIQDNGEGISADDGIRPQIASPKSKTWDGEKRKYALGQQEVAGDSASIVASTKLHVLENVPRVKQQVVKDISAGIADAENSLNSDNFIVKQVTSVGDFPKIASAESVGFMNKIDSKLTKGKEKSFEKNVMVRSDSYKNFDGSEVQGTSVHGEIKSSLKNGSKGNLFRPCLDKIPEGTKGHHQPDWKLNKANTSSSSHLIVKSQFRSKDKDGRPLAGNQSIKENELNRDGSKSVKRRPSSEIGEKECLPEEIGDSLEAYGDRMIIQALMATENCPWRNLKKRASSSGSVVPKSKTKTEKRLVDRKSASMGFSFSQQKNKDLIEDDDNVLEEVKTRKALTVYQKQNELSTTMTPFVPHEFSHKSSDNEAVARHKVKRALRLFQLICRKLLQGEESRSKRFGKANRIDLQASSMLKENGEWVNSGEPLIGHVPGVEIGDEFHYRVELAVVGLHRPFQSGIDYTKKNGIQVATSIVASGGYQDDMDSTDVLIYSGSGGNTVGGDKQPGDQKLERGNLALKNSIDTQLPVRVIHGFKEKGDPHDARSKLVSTFTYDGLYDVEKYWQERGPHGFNVFKFQLKRKAGQPELPFKELKRSAKLKIREGLPFSLSTAMAKLSLPMAFLLISASLAAGEIIDDYLTLPSDARFPAATAERLIRSLNLLPKDPSPETPADATNTPHDSIVERPLRLTTFTGEVSADDLGHRAGYYRLPNTHGARMFYFFFESRQSKKDPVVIWLTGGPGCSSELAVFYENGPFNIADNMSLVWNEFGWDKESNLIYVDQPTGTGFSYSSDSRDIRHDEKGVSDDLYDFLQAFFSHHPEYVTNDFYITGESYAGHYIPAFASRVRQGNKAKEGIHINLKGFAIGNGLTDPAIQYKAYSDYALEMGIIKETDYKRINKIYPACEMAIKLCGSSGKIACMASYVVCNTIFNSIMKIAGNTNYYDVRKECEGSLCYDFSNMEKFLNQKSVRESLGVGEVEFVSCSPTVYEAMLTDWMRDMEVGIPALLEDGIKLLVYAGEYDLICNWLGNSRWVHAMEWSDQQAFVSSSEKPFTVDGRKAGVLKSHGPLSFLKVHDAGHMVPMDQPRASLEMLRRWMKGELAEVPSDSEGIAADM